MIIFVAEYATLLHLTFEGYGNEATETTARGHTDILGGDRPQLSLHRQD